MLLISRGQVPWQIDTTAIRAAIILYKHAVGGRDGEHACKYIYIYCMYIISIYVYCIRYATCTQQLADVIVYLVVYQLPPRVRRARVGNHGNHRMCGVLLFWKYPLDGKTPLLTKSRSGDSV